MIELLAAFGVLGIQQIASLVFGLVRSKILAAFTGPVGVGIVAQANSFILLIRQVSNLGIGSGFIKLTAESRGEENQDRLNRIVVTVFVLISVLGLITVATSGLFSRQIATWVFDEPEYDIYIVFSAAAAFFIIQYTFILNLFRGLLQWKEYTLASVAGYGVSIFITAGLIVVWGVWGAVLSLLAAQMMNFGIAAYLVRKRTLRAFQLRFWRYRPSLEVLRALMRFVGPLLSIRIISALSNLFVRSRIIHFLGAEQNGLYQTVEGISLAYMGFVTGLVWSYSFPKIAANLKDPSAVVRVQNDGLRISLLFVMPIALVLLALREIWIPLLYSPAFLCAGSFLIWQVAGDMIQTVRQNINADLLPLERFKYLLGEGLAYHVIFMVCAVALLPVAGIAAVSISYLIINVILLVPDLWYHRMFTSFRIRMDNLKLIAKGLPLLVVGFGVSQNVADLMARYGIVLSVLVIMIVWLPEKGEVRQLVEILLGYWRKIREPGAADQED